MVTWVVCNGFTSNNFRDTWFRSGTLNAFILSGMPKYAVHSDKFCLRNACADKCKKQKEFLVITSQSLLLLTDSIRPNSDNSSARKALRKRSFRHSFTNATYFGASDSG